MDLNNVYYRLNDPAEIKLCILLCIRYAQEPLSDSQLKSIMLSGTNVDFVELFAIIDELIPENYIKKVWRDETEKYDLTPQGLETIDVFDDKITASVRASIKNKIDELLKRDGQKAHIKCVVTPTGNDLYSVDAQITEGKITLLSMTLFSGSKEKAARFAKAFRKKPLEFYASMIDSLTKLAEVTENEEENEE